MRKTILMLLLAIVSSSAMAEWVKVGGSTDGTLTVYAIPSSIRKVGSKAKIWTLGDYKVAKDSGMGNQYRSTKSQEEYDCKEEQGRTLYLAFYSENMGEGEIIGTHQGAKEWLPIMPESINEALWKTACKKP
jgi:hypothetical protein